MKKCSQCGYEWPDKNTFCGKCGNPLSSGESEWSTDSFQEINQELNNTYIPELPQSLLVCKNCGKEISSNAAFCKYCGTSTRASLTSNNNIESNSISSYNQNFPMVPEKESNPNLMICPTCHKEISRFATSCPNCGHPFPENAPRIEPVPINGPIIVPNESKKGLGVFGVIMVVILVVTCMACF